ncbi:hypothetical protein [Mesorhizobium sp. M0213]|uniref:oxidoreductase n=1 Tax=Mesorhizobium sp. M0213 TaxID=2956917 RepID=UPI00333D91FA
MCQACLSAEPDSYGAENGWNFEDSIALAVRLKEVGVDVINCSSGGLTDATTTAAIPRGLGFQLAFSARIRRETGVMTQAVGMIVNAQQAEEILAADDADLIAIGREALSILSGLGTQRTRSAQTPSFAAGIATTGLIWQTSSWLGKATGRSRGSMGDPAGHWLSLKRAPWFPDCS